MILQTTDEILGHLERGDLAKDFAAAVREVCTALTEVEAGKGQVSLKLNFSTKGEMVSIKADLSTSLPKRERKTSSAFITADGKLSLQHPNQIEMFSERKRSAADA